MANARKITDDYTENLDAISVKLANQLDLINAAKWLISDLEYQYEYDYQYDDEGNVLRDSNGDSLKEKSTNSLRNVLLDIAIKAMIDYAKK